MGRKHNYSACRDTAMSLLLAALCLGGAAVVARGQLTDDFYDGCCPQAEDIVKARVSAAMKTEFRMGASLLRLHFHDCFVNVRARSHALGLQVPDD
jgi:peroxidase